MNQAEHHSEYFTGRSLWELLEKRCLATSDLEMLVDDQGRRVTFGDFKNRVESMAAGFMEMGLVAEDRVSWQLPTWVDSIVLSAALNRIGVLQNPILPIYREREVGFCAAQSDAKILVVPQEFRGFSFGEMADGIAEKNSGLQILKVEPDGFPAGDPSDLPPPPTAPDDPKDLPVRWLLYTSGTTADPKGALHTDASIAAVSLGMAKRLECESNDRSILAFPFTHIGGITWMFTALQFGLCNLLTEAFDPQSTSDFMAHEKVTIAGSGTPFHHAYLNIQRQNPEKPLFENVRCCPGGGAPKPPQLHYEIKDELGGAGVVSGWGLTEVPILTMGSVSDPDEKLAETEGRAMPGVELIVVPLDEGEDQGEGEASNEIPKTEMGGVVGKSNIEGELRAKAPQMMWGYMDSSLDVEAFDSNGYFRTGDLGVIDADGYVTITGRLKDIIIRHGENISAKEVEDLLYTHDSVQDVAVIGLPDEKTGERVCAVVSIAEGKEPLSFEVMADFLKSAGLRRQAVPEQLEIVEAIPRNASGKILKQNLREQFSS